MGLLPASTCQGPFLIATIIHSATYLLLGLVSNPSKHLARWPSLSNSVPTFQEGHKKRPDNLRGYTLSGAVPNTPYGSRDEVTITGAS